MADLSIVKSEPLDTGAGLHLVKSEPLPQEKQGFLSAFWEGVGGKTLMDLMGGASRDPAAAQKSIDTLKGLASGLTNEGPRILKELDSAGEAARKGDWGLVAHHVAGAAPLFGAGVQQAGKDWEDGNYSAAAGHTLALFVPGLLHKAPGAAAALADTDAGAAVIGGAKGGAKALVETQPLTVKGLTMPVPTTAASAAAGGQAAAMMGLPRSLGTVAGAAAPVLRGAVKGARAALTQRVMQAAARAKLQTAEVTATSPQQPAGLLSPPARVFAPEAPPDTSFVRAVPGQYPPNEALPVQPPRALLPAGPNVIQMGPAADGSFVRSVPGEYPANEMPTAPAAAVAAPAEDMALLDDIAQGQTGKPFAKLNPAHQKIVREIAGRLNRPAAVADKPATPAAQAPEARIHPNMTRADVDALQSPSESPIATETAPEETAPQSQTQEIPGRSPYYADGSKKSPQVLTAEKVQYNRTVKAGKLAQALSDGGISLEDAKQMDPSHWKMLADGIGVNVPSKTSIAETIAQLQKLARAK